MKILHWIKDKVLAALQQNCQHPGEFVAVDVLEGTVEGIQVQYCRRCGAIKTDWGPTTGANKFVALDHTWRSPDPDLWRGL